MIERKWLIATVFVVGLLVGTGGSTAYFATNPITETEYKTVYSTVEKPVSAAGVVFSIRKGPDAPSGWEFPVRVEFRRVVGGDWDTRYVVKATEGERFVVALNETTRYQITAHPASGESRVLGSFVPQHSDDSVELIIGGCCYDDFS